MDPQGDPLGIYLRPLSAQTRNAGGCARLARAQPPFVGLHTRIDELCAHHHARCLAIADACRRAPCAAADLVPSCSGVDDDPHQMGFTFGEVLAHVNYSSRGTLACPAQRPSEHAYSA